MSEHIESLLTALRGHEVAFAGAASHYRVQLECVICVDANTASPELVLPFDHMRALIEMGIAAVGLDIN